MTTEGDDVVGLSEMQIDAARKLWRGGMTLEQIATLLECGLFDLSPWLYVDEWNAERVP